MHLFGFSKKTKKRLSSGPLNLGLRRSKSTGNIPSHDNATERDDSSTDSSGGSSANSNNDMKKQQTDQQFQEKPSTIGRNEKPTQKGLVLETPAPQAQVQAQAADDTKLPPLTAAMDRLNIKENGIPSTHSDDSLVSKAVTTEPTKQQPQQTKTGGGAWKSGGDEKWNSNGINPEDLDSLLSMETQQRVEAQRERRDKAAAAVESAPTTPLRPTRLKFELPVTPSRSRSPSNQPITYPRARPDLILKKVTCRSIVENHPMLLLDVAAENKLKENGGTDDELGAYVTLIKRPLPTMGYVRYIGPVEGEPGDWVGVELEHRVGNCDGLIKGQRFFKTDPQRGIFTKRFDLEVVVV
ncbi:hypothetical protein BCR42DRAFT_402214 [Absidia repens]|uniref:CAP-Gly domain-containing protein n=1 Tax=Absidia repens TaxID=90262 RepID=A0A1X2IXU1_9FUNG|nr:hypothetical protein BCR42DRAFT_402214 [Absidia repens]